MQKWLHGAIPALLIHCSIGSVYAWSLFVIPIATLFGVSAGIIQIAFSLAIFFLGMSAAFLGNIVERNVKKSAIISLIFFTTGLLVTAAALYFHILPLVFIGYGVLMGIGLGVGYLTPIKTLMMWFADKKGLATGIAITGFGFASAIASPIITALLATFSLPIAFIILAGIYFIPLLIAVFLIKKPYKDVQKNDSFSYRKMFKDKRFVKIWFMMFINISCGLALISIASPLMVGLGIGAGIIAMVISIMGIFNGFGRLILATLSDKLPNRKIMYEIIFTVSIILCALAFITKLPILIGLSLIIISATYGAGFSCLPALLSDIYGMENISKIHGLSLSAWGMAGLCGNQLSSLIFALTGNYLFVYVIIEILYIIGLVLSKK